MKINKKGKIVLQGGDYRVGNFIFHREKEYIKVTATSGLVSWRVSAESSVGQLLNIALEGKHDNWLKTYAAMNFSQLMVIPDDVYFHRHAEIVNEQTAKHPEYYGKAGNTSDKKEDDRIVEEERELHDALEEVTR